MNGILRLDDLTKALSGLAARVLDYALVLAAVGTVTMALVELLKAVTRARLLYHRWMVWKWIGRSDAIRRELLNLAAGGSAWANALYDQPSERMMGQIQAAANVALDFPAVYAALYGFFTAGSAAAGSVDDSERWRRFAPRIAQGVPIESAAKAEFEADSRESTQARARLGHLVTRRLDAFQTRIDYGWARLNQTIAVAGGALLLYYLLPAAVNTVAVPRGTRLALAVVGGLVAPFAKDVVNALSGLRVRR